MKQPPCSILLRATFRCALLLVLVGFFASLARAADRRQAQVNEAGAPVRDANGQPINYDQATLEAMMRTTAANTAPAPGPELPLITQPAGFVPAVPGVQRPFWQYALFGSGIGASNILIAPAAVGVLPEIIVNGNTWGNFGAANFWHVLRWNTAASTYDQTFVGPLYNAALKTIALGNVTGDPSLEIAVMLENGRIYLYDLASKAELGYITTGLNSLESLTLADLNGDSVAEVIVTNLNDLFVFSGEGNLLWQVAGAGGYDVVAGQMDNDDALEIAATKGAVVDTGTKTIQWTRNGGFGFRVELAPLPGESYQQLIVLESWSLIYSYDVRRQLPRWSISTSDNDALLVADVENDGMPEVILGEGQWGEVRVYDLLTQTQKWFANNPEHGVTNIAVGDVDGDGVKDLLWGSGHSSSGADYLYVAHTTGNRAIKWQNFDLTGPFVGPLIGDLDGDQKPELVACSYQAESGYDAGRILVFDLATLTLRGISAPVAQNSASGGIRDLKLRDVDGDGPLEIVVATSSYYTGSIEVYGFSSGNLFTRKWANAARSDYAAFTSVEVLDLDGNGTREVVGAAGSYLYIYDYPAITHSWQSLNLASGITSLLVEDLDTIGGSKEIAALVANGDLYTFDGPSRQLRDLRQATGTTLLSKGVTPFGLIAGDNKGVGHFLHYGDDDYTERFSRQLGSAALTGINVLANGTVWSTSGSTLRLQRPPLYQSLAWETPALGNSLGRFVAREVRAGEERIFSAAGHAVMGLIAPHDALGMITAASRKTHGVGALDVSLPLAGNNGVESRSSGPNGEHTIVFAFNNDVVSGSAAITDGPGSISGAPTFANNTMTVNLTGVPDAEWVTITLSQVTDSFSQVLPSSAVTVGFLVGDTNGDGSVNAGDALQTRSRSGQAVTWANQRFDVNRDGAVNGGDATIVRARSGNAIP